SFNRFKFVTAQDFVLAPGQTALFVYDSSGSRWRLAGNGTTGAAMIYSPGQFTSNQNDLIPDLHVGPAASNDIILRIDIDANRSFTGIDPSCAATGRLTLVNISSFNLTLSNQSSSSSAANRFLFPDGNDYVLLPNMGITLWYDNTSTRWRPMG